MGSKSAEDGMDLGPFMQNYVLKNPFDQLRHPLSVGNAPKSPPAPPPQTKKPSSGANSCPNSRGASPAPFTSTTETVSSTETVSTSGKTPQVAEAGSTPISSSSSKGHMGSNVFYAYNVNKKQVSLSTGNTGLQFWLWNNYKHYPSYSGSITMGSLHKHVEEHFPHVTTLVLSRVMKYTFPSCNKFISKGGAHYQGLVKKPDAADYGDEALTASVDAVRLGVMDLGKAMATYAVEESRIVRMLVWEHAMNVPLKKNAKRRKKAPRKSAVSQSVNDSVTDTQSDDCKDSDCGENSDTEAPKKLKTDKTASICSRPVRKSSRHRKRPSYIEDFEYTLDSVVKNETDSDVDYKKDSDNVSADCDDIDATDDHANVSLRDDCDAVNLEQVIVKDEIEDLEYNHSEKSNRDLKRVILSTPKPRFLDLIKKKGDIEKDAIFIEPDVSNEALLGYLEYVEERLREKEEANKSLLHELSCARTEADELRSEMSRRDTETNLLADSFFSLNHQFQKLQHQFKHFLSSTALKNAQLGIVNNNNNVDLNGT